MARKLEVEIVGDARSLNRALGSAETSTKGLGNKFGQLAKTAKFVGGAAAIGAVSFAVKDVIGDMIEGQRVTAQTNAVLRSTGKVANVTSKGVQGLATSIAMKSGIDDEAIQSGENLLLTFTNIRNEAGKGNDIFNQATKVTTDLSVAFGKDLNSSAVLVGKALNDPIKGLTALSRVGVQFTKGQKETIKSLVDSGHQMEAQKLILSELNTQVGGSAEAMGKTLPGQINIAKMAFENWAESMITKATPAIQNLAAEIKTSIPEAKQAIVDFWTTVKPDIMAFRDLMVTTAGLIQKHWDQIKPVVLSVRDVIVSAMRLIGAEIRLINALLRGDWSQAWEQAKKVATAAGQQLLAVTKLFLYPYKLALEAAEAATRALASAIGTQLHNALEGVQAGFIWIRDKGADVFRIAWAAISKPIHALNDAVRALASALNSVKSALDWLLGKAGAVGKFFGGIAGAVGGAAKRVGDSSSTIRAGGSGGGPVTGSAAKVGAAWGVGQQLWDEIAIGQSHGLQVTSGFRPNARTKHGTLSDHAKHAAVDMSGSAQGMALTFRDLLGRREIRQAFYDPLGSIFGGQYSSYREGGHSDHIHIAEYARGGTVPGPRGAPQLAIVHGGEYVDPNGRGGNIVFNFPNYVGSRRELVETIQNEAALFKRRTGRSLV